MNKFWLLGNLTKDPKKVELPNNDTKLCTFTVASDRGRGVNGTDFFNISVFGKFAEVCAKYLKKGSRVNLWGEIRSRSFENAEGTKLTAYDVYTTEVHFLSTKGESVTISTEEADDDKSK